MYILPVIGETYTHHSGRIYTVIGLANLIATSKDYPPTVVYQDENGATWTKTIQRFHETMRLIQEVKLNLSLEEAQWLKGIMQNPIYCDDPTDEDEQFKQLRLAFWNKLKDVSVF